MIRYLGYLKSMSDIASKKYKILGQVKKKHMFLVPTRFIF